MSVNGLGYLNRYGVKYRDGVATVVEMRFKPPGEDYDPPQVFDISNLDAPSDLDVALGMMEKGNRLLNSVCNGSEADRKQYAKLLLNNLKKLGLRAADYPSDLRRWDR